jgi:protease I
MKALILIADGFDDLQFFYPWYRLQEEGLHVTVAGSSGQQLTGLHNYKVEPDMPIHELNPSEYDLLVVPGGTSPERLRQREEAVDIARTFMEEDRLVAIIGHGAQLLISAGAIDGRALTSAAGIRDDVRAAGGVWREDGAVTDGLLISARTSDDLPAFCQHIVAALLTRTR